MAEPDRQTDYNGLDVLSGRPFHATRMWRTLPAGMPRRWWMFRPLDLIARHWPLFKRRRGVLVVRMDGIGDMVLFRSSLDHYARAFGVAAGDITILGCRSWQSIASEVFAGTRVRVIDEHAFARRPFYRFRTSLWVRGLAPAVVVCDSYMRRPLMADSLVWVAGAPRSVVSLPYIGETTRPVFTYYLSQVDEIIDTGPYPTHEVVRHHRFISALAGEDLAPVPPRIRWRDAPPPIDEGAPYVVLGPGSNEPGRRWPIEAFAGIAGRLQERGYRVVVVGKAGERPGGHGMAALTAVPGVIDLGGGTSLPQLMDLMNHAAAVVANDSGPAHLAMALGTPTVVIVGGGHFGCFFPYPDGVAPANARFISHDMTCYHCFWRCPKRASRDDVFPCIGAITEDAAWQALDGLLPASVAGRPAVSF